MHGALGWRLDHGVFPDQLVSDLGCSPGRVFALYREDCAFNLAGQLVGMAIGSAATILQAIETTNLVTIEDFIARVP